MIWQLVGLLTSVLQLTAWLLLRRVVRLDRSRVTALRDRVEKLELVVSMMPPITAENMRKALERDLGGGR